MIETKFKNTEVGRIPEDWEEISLGDVGEVKMCKRIMKYQTSDKGDIPFYKIGTFGKSADAFISKDLYESFKSKYNYPKKGDILLSAAGTIGRTVVFNGEPSYFQDSNIVWIENDEHLLSNALLYYIYKNLSWVTESGTIPRIYNSIVKSIKFCIPVDKSEQIRIATALSNIDTLISELGKLIEKKRAIKQGAMQQLLTGKKRLKGFSEPWVEKKLGENATILRGGSPRPIEDYITDSQDGLNWIKIGDVKPDDKYFRKTAEKIKKEGLTKTRQVKKGDFILSNSMSFGRPYILDIDGCIHDGWLVIQDYQEAYDMQFLYYVLCSDGVKNQYIAMAAGSSVQNLNKEKVANVILNAPVSLEEQTAVASVLSSMDDEISALETKKAKYEQIKQGMMQQLLTGKIRLVNIVAKTNTISANVHFRRSVLAAEIAERLYAEPTFGHVKMEKMLFLTERLCHIDIGSHYHRDAAGPYDNRALRSIDSQLRKQKWFDVRRTEKGNRYVPMQNCGKHKAYYDKYYSTVASTFDKIINTFKTQNTERCEIVATLYSAWEDLLHSNKSFTDADIVNEVLNNWHESKKRISKERWLSAIQWMRENGFAPNV